MSKSSDDGGLGCLAWIVVGCFLTTIVRHLEAIARTLESILVQLQN